MVGQGVGVVDDLRGADLRRIREQALEGVVVGGRSG
jgi:hypothetical protein